MTPPPSPEDQLQFLSRLQRLFNEGDFTATYKFALLMALSDLSVERGSDDGEPLLLSHKAIAFKFIELYWQQTAPYSTGRTDATPDILIQNTGVQAAVVTEIKAFRLLNPGTTMLSARSHPGFDALVSKVAKTVAAQPINYLQNLGGQTITFIFERERGAVQLLPGVAYCLRRFEPLINQLARSYWVQHIKHNRLNHPMLGDTDDLEEFLFRTPRQALVTIGAGLRKLTDNLCFYCGRKVDEADVDHFIPFSLYPRDLMHNFVLAHPGCNRSKSDTLAAKVHLDRWFEYIHRHDHDLVDIGTTAGRLGDLRSSLAITRWGYGNALSSGAQAWLKAGVYEAVTQNCIQSLATAY